MHADAPRAIPDVHMGRMPLFRWEKGGHQLHHFDFFPFSLHCTARTAALHCTALQSSSATGPLTVIYARVCRNEIEKLPYLSTPVLGVVLPFFRNLLAADVEEDAILIPAICLNFVAHICFKPHFWIPLHHVVNHCVCDRQCPAPGRCLCVRPTHLAETGWWVAT
jgi:hypothetical protein